LQLNYNIQFKLNNLNRAISKEWRQKIENWLHANEQDGKSVEDYRRNIRRVPNTKRSLENEKGNKSFMSCKINPLKNVVLD
jgi:hypothetical protein